MLYEPGTVGEIVGTTGVEFTQWFVGSFVYLSPDSVARSHTRETVSKTLE